MLLTCTRIAWLRDALLFWSGRGRKQARACARRCRLVRYRKWLDSGPDHPLHGRSAVNWADPVAALALLPIVIRETNETLEGTECCAS